MDPTLTTVARLLRASARPLFITGAGLSADSGLPTYRGVGGLYDDVDTEDGVPIEVALSGPTMARRPELTWKYLWQIGEAIARGRFNRGHAVIADVERAKPDTWVLTQNVDGYHHDAGSRNLIEIHGRFSSLGCASCGARRDAAALLGRFETRIELPPRCESCDGVVRPLVVLFEERLPVDELVRLEHALRDRDLVVSVGTSALFPYIAGPVLAARAAGVPTVEINPSTTPVSDAVDHRIELGAAAALERIWRAVG